MEQGRPVVVLNDRAARTLFGGEQPVGRVIHSGFLDRRSTVVGVVQDVRSEGLDQAAAATVYMPYLSGWGLKMVVRSDLPSEQLIPALRNAANGVVLQRFQRVDDMVERTVRERRSAGVIIAVLALVGLVVSRTGLYGMMAAQVHQRRREYGLRIALGSPVAWVMAAVVRLAARVVIWGCVAGFLGSAALARVVQGQLYGIAAADAASFLIATAVLCVCVLLACLLPALNAIRIDPIEALNSN